MHKTEREIERKRGGRDGSAIHEEWLEMITKKTMKQLKYSTESGLKNEEECGHKDSNISLLS